jgi:hypothetical protein
VFTINLNIIIIIANSFIKKNFKKYTGILYKYGWLVGYWAGDKSISGSLLHLKFDPYKSSIIAWKLAAVNKSRYDSWSENPLVRLIYTEPEFKYQILFCVQYDYKQHKSKVLRNNMLYEEDNEDEEYTIRKALFEKHHESELWKQDEVIVRQVDDDNDITFYQEGKGSIIEQQSCFSFEDEKYFKFWIPKDNENESKRFDGIWAGDYGILCSNLFLSFFLSC